MRPHFFSYVFRRVIPVFAAPILISWIFASCAGTPSGGEDSKSQVDESSGDPICLLNGEGTAFLCDMEFSLPPGQTCGKELPEQVRKDFIERMTVVSLEMLYLDGETGSRPPYRYNDLPRVLQQVRFRECTRSEGSCRCRLSYEDPALKEIFYDSAGCRASSRRSSHPLYFRGRGCR